jgi:hypothetical protein
MSEPFRLKPLPDQLWMIERLSQELRARPQTVRGWIRAGRLPGPCLRRDGRAYWDPTTVEDFRRRRAHRLGW